MLPRERQSVARVNVRTEAEGPSGWLFGVDLASEDAQAASTRHELTLAWVDYEYWAHGARSPSAVAEAVCAALLELRPEMPWPDRFDASTARRWAPDLDLRVRELM